MDNSYLKEIQAKLETLYDVLKEITPLNQINKHPFSVHSGYISQIANSIDLQVKNAKDEKESLVLEIEELKNKIKTYCYQLNIEIPCLEYDTMENLSLSKQLLSDELEKIELARKRIQTEIELLRNEIHQIKDCLGMDKNKSGMDHCENSHKIGSGCDKENISCYCEIDKGVKHHICHGNNEDHQGMDKKHHLSHGDNSTKRICSTHQEISLEVVAILKSELEHLKNERTAMESKRQSFYNEIERIDKILKVNIKLSYEEKICDLRLMVENLQNELRIKRDKFNSLLNEVRRKEYILALDEKELSGNLDEENIHSISAYNDYLKEEQSRLFNEIFVRTKQELDQINGVFGIQTIEYDKTEESLNEMRTLIESLIPKKDKFIKIAEAIMKRKALLEKMTEFEKIASDPRRLFRSSFQLNTEEKFRNSAYPSLLKMEESLFEMVDSYEQSFDKFIYENREYKSALKNEIENRIINRTVFISRCDSPFRKKK